MADAYTETADAIVDHAQSIARLRPARGECAYAEAVAGHVHSMRVLAAAHVDPVPDRAFLKALQAAASRADGVFVRFEDGVVQVFVDPHDPAARQQRFELVSPAQAARRD